MKYAKILSWIMLSSSPGHFLLVPPPGDTPILIDCELSPVNYYVRDSKGEIDISCLVSGNCSQSAGFESICTKTKSTLPLMDHAYEGTYEGCEFLIKLLRRPASNVVRSVCSISILVWYFCNIKFSLHSRRFRVCVFCCWVVLFFISLVEYVVVRDVQNIFSNYVFW